MSNIRDEIQDMYPDVSLLFMTEEEFDSAIIGVAERIGSEPAIAYDFDKVIEANMKMGMTQEEAIEYFDYNQIGAYVGGQTPIFITRFNNDTNNDNTSVYNTNSYSATYAYDENGNLVSKDGKLK